MKTIFKIIIFIRKKERLLKKAYSVTKISIVYPATQPMLATGLVITTRFSEPAFATHPGAARASKNGDVIKLARAKIQSMVWQGADSNVMGKTKNLACFDAVHHWSLGVNELLQEYHIDVSQLDFKLLWIFQYLTNFAVIYIKDMEASVMWKYSVSTQ